MFSFVCLMVVSLMVVFNNSIFYLMSVLFMSSYILFFLVANNILSVLIFILIVIVYVGAMMILIGYICAVSPNPVLLPRLNLISILLFLSFSFFVLFPFEFKFYGVGVNKVVVSDVFFTSWGMVSFVCVVVMLFVTLLMVTSQSSSPQGTFRSV